MRFDEKGNIVLADVPKVLSAKRKVTLGDRERVTTGAAVTLAEAAELLGVSAEDAARLLAESAIPRHACWDSAAVRALADDRRRTR